MKKNVGWTEDTAEGFARRFNAIKIFNSKRRICQKNVCFRSAIRCDFAREPNNANPERFNVLSTYSTGTKLAT